MPQIEEYRKQWSKYPSLDKKYYFDQLSLEQIKNILSLEESLKKDEEDHSEEEDDDEENNEEDNTEIDTQDKNFHPPVPYVVHGSGISYCQSEINTEPISNSTPTISFCPPSNELIMLSLVNCEIRVEDKSIPPPKYYGSPQYEVLISRNWKPKKA